MPPLAGTEGEALVRRKVEAQDKRQRMRLCFYQKKNFPRRAELRVCLLVLLPAYYTPAFLLHDNCRSSAWVVSRRRTVT
jgi:hypothetical protein